MSYWLSRDGQQFGPYSLEDLRRMLALGQAGPRDWAWKEGMPQWVPLLSVTSGAKPGTAFGPSVTSGQHASFQEAYVPNFNLIPPDIHWIWILVLALPTLGIFPFIWFLNMTAFGRKLDPDETPMYLAIAGFASIHVGNFLKIAHSYDGPRHANPGLAGLFVLEGAICYMVAKFRMRQTLLAHYNSVEPIGLYLSGAMTFFFGTLYLQHHFSRIAQWKRTGFLEPQ